MNSANLTDPFSVLKLPRDASEAEIRSRYLDLVKQFPPDREPEKFREVRAAYEAIKDPLEIARRLLEPPADDVPTWDQVLEAQKRNPPRLTPALLLSLGNRLANEEVLPSVPDNNADPSRSLANQQDAERVPLPSASSHQEADGR